MLTTEKCPEMNVRTGKSSLHRNIQRHCVSMY